MKVRITQQWVTQWFIFNIILFIVFAVTFSTYVLPSYSEIDEKKVQLEDIFDTYNDLQKRGLSFSWFTFLHKKLWNTDLRNYDKNSYLQSVFSEFSSKDFERYFVNTWSVSYESFLADQELTIDTLAGRFKDKWRSTVIDKILPYYSNDAWLSEWAFTDFRFVNYIEFLLNAFRLKSTDSLWIWTLKPVESFASTNSKNWKWVRRNNSLDSTIFWWELSLSIVWSKKNIIDFIYFLQNVWKISIVDWKIRVLQADSSWLSIKNSDKKVNMYNNLIMVINDVKFDEYLDSSDLPTPSWVSITNFVREDQWKEKYKASMTLGFFVKWLPTYKIESSISNVGTKYSLLKSIVKEWVSYTKAHRGSLQNTRAISAITNFNKYNAYLLSINKEIKSLDKQLKKWENISSLYKDALSYDRIFTSIAEWLVIDLEAIEHKKLSDFKNTLFPKNNTETE
jgi:hypothetical protein